MESRPKKQLSLKQRKLVFQPTPKDHLIKDPQIQPLALSATTEEESQDPTQCVPDDSIADPAAHPHSCLPYSGLCNLGNTCYVNSILQVLRYCPGFCTNVLEMHENLKSAKELGEDSMDTLSSHLCKLWRRMAQKEKTVSKATNKINSLCPTKPDTFLAKLRQENQLFDNKSQHDAQEMLRFLLTNLHDTYTSITPSESPPPPTVTSSHISTPPPTFTPSHISTPPDTNTPTSNRRNVSKKRKLSSLEKLARPIAKFLKLNSGKMKTVQSQQKLDSYFKSTSSCPSNEPTPEPVAEKKHCPNLIPDTFQGSLAYQTRCFECENTTRRSEAFLDVSVPVSYSGLPGFPLLTSPMKTPSGGSGSFAHSCSVVGPYSLSWCLSQFALREKLRGDNKYHCDECGRFTEAERSLLFSELPSVMTIHLNRFTTQAWGHSANITVSKIRGNIAVPLVLSFKPWTTEDCKGRDKVYELFAVVFHSGSSCMSGHYTACVRMEEAAQLSPAQQDDVSMSSLNKNSWLYFDDENVELLSQSTLLSLLSPLSDHSSTAYILFYTAHSQ